MRLKVKTYMGGHICGWLIWHIKQFERECILSGDEVEAVVMNAVVTLHVFWQFSAN